jgi:hypothetical protein
MRAHDGLGLKFWKNVRKKKTSTKTLWTIYLAEKIRQQNLKQKLLD